jgi:uncharacterized YigZ family protein
MNTLADSPENPYKTSVLSSEFLCYLQKVESIQQAQAFQKELRALHPKANHHCLAYRIGAESVQEFASDDGEPSGTAGLPMLNVLKRKDITQIVAVVVRYFGGTKLGKKGLIDAYRDSVELALQNLAIKPIEKRIRLTIHFPYSLTSDLQKTLHSFDVTLESERYEETVSQTLHISVDDYSNLESKLLLLTNFGIELSEPESFFL